MKTLDVNNLGVQEMNAGEMRESNGGFTHWLAGLAAGVVISFFDNFGDFKAGVKVGMQF